MEGPMGSHLVERLTPVDGRSDLWSAEELLVEAGLVGAIEEAEQRAVYVRRDIRLSFDRRRVRCLRGPQRRATCAADLVSDPTPVSLSISSARLRSRLPFPSLFR